MSSNRPRGAKWRSEELVTLIEAYGQRRAVLEGSFSTGGVTTQSKKEAWEAIARYLSR